MKLVTFDAAGTLIHHKWDPAGIAKEAARACGIALEETEARNAYAVVTKRHRDELVERERSGDRSAIAALWQLQTADWLSELGQEPSRAPEVLEEFRRRSFGPNSTEWSLFPDVLPTIAKLRLRGAVIGILSNWDHTLHTVLDNLGVASKFDFAIASLEVGFEKPDKQIFDEALRRSGAEAADALHIGDDYDDDYIGATNAGWKALFIDRSSQPALSKGRISRLTQAVELLV